jgi:hypothetical protein
MNKQHQKLKEGSNGVLCTQLLNYKGHQQVKKEMSLAG